MTGIARFLSRCRNHMTPEITTMSEATKFDPHASSHPSVPSSSCTEHITQRLRHPTMARMMLLRAKLFRRPYMFATALPRLPPTAGRRGPPPKTSPAGPGRRFPPHRPMGRRERTCDGPSHGEGVGIDSDPKKTLTTPRRRPKFQSYLSKRKIYCLSKF